MAEHGGRQKEKCVPQQKVRIRNQCFWQAYDPGEIYGHFRGLGAPSRKGAYFEALERNRVF